MLQYRTDLQAVHVFNFLLSPSSAMPQEAQRIILSLSLTTIFVLIVKYRP